MNDVDVRDLELRAAAAAFRPPTPMVACAWVVLHGTRPGDREQAARTLAALVLEASDARPAPAA